MASPFGHTHLPALTDRDLIAEVHRLTQDERQATARLIAALMELDARRLYLSEGCSSLFTYCTQVLHFSEHAAYGRIEAARAARRFPAIIDLLTDGSITLTAVGLLAARLTAENYSALLSGARHKSKRDVERMVAEIRPQPPVASSVRKLPAPRSTVSAALAVRPPESAPMQASPAIVHPAGELFAPTPASTAPDLVRRQEAPAKPAVIAPLGPERYKLQVTISREAHDHLRRAQDLLRHVIPNGDPAAIVERGLALLVQQLETKKLAAATRPRDGIAPLARSRRVPAAVKRAVWARDEGRCAFIGATGRCSERGFLEMHHVIPFADGGKTDVPNIQLRCRAHNAYEAEGWFGPLEARERPIEYISDSVRTELLVSCPAWPTTQGSSGLNRRGTRRSAARRSRRDATDATPSG
jgi:hypothetical protein